MMGKTRQERKQDKAVYLAGAIFLIILVVGAVIANGVISRQRSVVTKTSEQVQSDVLGDRVDTAGYGLKLNGVKKEPLRPGFYKITASVAIQNLTSSELQISAPLQFALQDSQGVYYSVNAAESKDTLSGPVAGNMMATGDIAFVVPDTASKFDLVFVAQENTPKKVIPLKFSS